MTNSTAPQPVQEPAGAVGDDLRKLRFIYRVLSNFAAAPQSDRGDAYAMVRELIESTWNRGRDASPQAALLGPAGAVGIALDALEKLNERPRPMCRDCADNPDDLCPNSGLPCDMRKCIADARSALASLPPVTQVKSEAVAFQYWTAGEFWKETSRLGYEARRNAGEKVRALYDHPQEAVERQPLTDEQIASIYYESPDLGKEYDSGANRFARAIEAAHGIGSGSAQEGQAK